MGNAKNPVPEPVRTAADLAALSGSWDNLASSFPCPACSHAWALAATRVLGQDEELWTLAVGSGRPEAIAPLSHDRNRVGRLQLLSMSLLWEPMDLLYGDLPALEKLARLLAESKWPLRLDRIPADSPTAPALRQAFRGKGHVRVRPALGCPFVRLDKSWEEPDRHLSPGRRSDLHRMRRKADRMGRVTMEVLKPSRLELPALLDQAFAIEAASWKGRKGSALAARPDLGEFFRFFSALACEAGVLRIAFLRIDGRGVAVQIAVQKASAFWLLKIGYDERYGDCSPGTLLLAETLRWAAQQGLDTFEFLGKEEPWTRVWTRHVRSLIGIRTYPANARGSLALADDASHAAWHRVRGGSEAA